MRKSLGILLATATLSLASACGGGSSDGTDAKPAADVRAATASAPAPTTAPLTRENFVERIGKAQAAAGGVHLETTADARGQEVALSGDVQLGTRPEDSSAQLSMQAGPMPIDARLVDGVLYLKIAALTDGKYARLDLDEAQGALSQQFGSMTEGVDPARQLEAYEKALVEFENLGDGGEVDGVSTTRLRLVIDPTKLPQHGTKAGRVADQRITMTLQVGADDLLRTLTAETDQMETTVSWSRWGEPVEVTAPSKGEIAEGDLLSRLAGLGGDASSLRG